MLICATDNGGDNGREKGFNEKKNFEECNS
jgi:hypothetical protein